ncbi:restriction endonuclease subunit S [Dolichospermum sp. UHCC 0352]|uniref:restriction endonuclease subunit S n=1 Tax=Dolichospermum sp. UHCC 0352 TaxID=2590011 RepID=UPI001444C139|nr:restriction endonuclease subunit S [Dolichospermum sp. UHCC 0352]MTJ23704.1 restriction endonuclease subunit S [Dolichospermum sp. UHCC 0352]
MNTDWKEMKLIDVLQKTETINPQKNPNASFEYIDVSSICNKRFVIQEVSTIVGKNAPSRARRLVRKGDILFATVRPTLKRIAEVPQYLDGQVCSTGYFVLRPKDFVEGKFLFYFLFTKNFMGAMEQLQKGASYPAVNDGDVSSQSIFIPPLPEQKRIVAIADEAFEGIDRAIRNTEKNLSNARELFESYLNSIFTQKGDGWEEKTLHEISTQFSRGKSKHRPRNDKKLYDGQYPFIQTGDIRNSNHIVNRYSQTYNEVGLAQSKLWTKGTVCITIAANIAETGVLDFAACIPDSIIGLVVDQNKANNMFVEYMLQAFKFILKAKGQGSAQDNINMGTFESQTFPFPLIDEQEKIVEKLDFLSAETQRLETIYRQKIAALKELKQSILQKAFTGELTVQLRSPTTADKGEK